MIPTSARPDPATLAALLRCPSCRGELAHEGSIRCMACHRTYPVVDGRPVLLRDGRMPPSKHNDVVSAQARQRTGAARRGLRGLVDRFRAATTAGIFADDQRQVPLLVDRVLPLLDRRDGWILDVGACEQYYRAALERLGRVVALDISLYQATDIVGDCHHLPIADASVTAITAIEVLEHLSRPWTFFTEAHRVLEPGGILFGVAPQYCPTHGFPHDYFRYTRGGIGALAEQAGLELVEAWPLGGRWGTLLHWYWANFARESRLHRIKGLNLLHHVWFQGVAHVCDRLDAHGQFGAVPLPQEHNDHVGWSFIIRRPA